MLIGSLQVKLHFPEGNSLKSKRFIVRSIRDRIRSGFNVSVAEIEDHDLWQIGPIGIVAVGMDQKYLNQVLDKVMNLLREERRLQIIESRLQFF